MENYVYVSSHSRTRIKERIGVGKGSALRIAERAVERGVYFEETKGSVRKWIDQKISKDNRQVYLYGDKAYFFANTASGDMILVTVLPMPQELVRKYMLAKRKKACYVA